MFRKRKMSDTEEDRDKDVRISCKYGSLCYQKNKAHHEKYKHPSDTSRTTTKDEISAKKPCGPSTTLKQQKLNFTIQRKENNTNTVRKNEQEDEVNEKKESPCKEKETETVEKDIEQEDEEEIEEKPSCSGNKKEIVDSDDEQEDEEEKVEETPSSDISIDDCKKIIKKLFLVDMPEDFFSFWSFCRSLSPRNPKDALNCVDLTLVGPFDVLAGTFKEDSVSSSEALLHWRYYYDPPEFQTILKSNKDLFHMGYFRDDPNSPPNFVAYNAAAKNSLIIHVAENIFGAVDWYISHEEKTINPFKKMKSSNVKSSLHKWAKEHDFTLEKYSKKMQERNKLTVSKTFHQAGIVVPYDKKTELGYRPLSETTNNLKKLLKKIETVETKEERTAHMNSLYTIVNWANIAMDEGDFGTNLELGLNLFSHGTDHFNSIIRSSLENAYNLLNRQAFVAIINAHLENRRKGDDLSVLKK